MLYKTIIIKGRPVSVNHSYKTLSRGRGAKNIYLDPVVRDYMESARWQAKIQWKDGVLDNDLEVTVKYYFGDNRRRDHLNYCKHLLDSLQQIVYKDDRQIKISHHYTFIDEIEPRVEILISDMAS